MKLSFANVPLSRFLLLHVFVIPLFSDVPLVLELAQINGGLIWSHGGVLTYLKWVPQKVDLNLAVLSHNWHNCDCDIHRSNYISFILCEIVICQCPTVKISIITCICYSFAFKHVSSLLFFFSSGSRGQDEMQMSTSPR